MKDAEILIKSKRLSGDDGYRSFSIRIKKALLRDWKNYVRNPVTAEMK